MIANETLNFLHHKRHYQSTEKIAHRMGELYQERSNIQNFPMTSEKDRHSRHTNMQERQKFQSINGLMECTNILK